MVCSIKLELGDPQGENDVLMEALANLGAQPLPQLKRGQHYLATPPDYFPDAKAVYHFLLRNSKGNDEIEVTELRGGTVYSTLIKVTDYAKKAG